MTKPPKFPTTLRKMWSGSEVQKWIDEHLTAACSSLPDGPVAGLHPRTADLVDRFCLALKEKLAAAEKKYGYSDGWTSSEWMDECRANLLAHVVKGDPRDVAAYCAFLWHHGERTSAALAAPSAQPPDEGFNPDWSLLKHTQESLREYMRMAKVALTQLQDLRAAAVRYMPDHPEIRAADAVIDHYVHPSMQRAASPSAQPSGAPELLALLKELRPMADYGRVGTRDIEQARHQKALDVAIELLSATAPTPSGAPADHEQSLWIRELLKLANEHSATRDGTPSKAEAWTALWKHAHNIGPHWRARAALAGAPSDTTKAQS